MSNNDVKRAIRAGWNAMSDSYQSQSHISTDDVHYAPLAPGERELGLLGDVMGKSVLELACGSAQNSIALAKWGARVTGLDISPRQLQKARDLATEERANVSLVLGDMECLGTFKDGCFDIVLSSFGIEFSPDPSTCVRECYRVLGSGGLLVVATAHPLSAFEWDEEAQALLVTDYFNPPVEIWNGSSSGVRPAAMTFFHSVEEMFGLLTAAGFSVERLLEPSPYSTNQRPEGHSPYAGPYWADQEERLKRVPFAIVYAARKVS